MRNIFSNPGYLNKIFAPGNFRQLIKVIQYLAPLLVAFSRQLETVLLFCASLGVAPMAQTKAAAVLVAALLLLLCAASGAGASAHELGVWLEKQVREHPRDNDQLLVC